MKQNARILNLLDTHWQAVCVSAICICLIMAVIAGIQARTAEVFKTADWGLSFGPTGTAPQGNVPNEELLQYNACYIGDTEKKTIYLTFDAGYENGYTPQILDTLQMHGVQATFFLVDHYLKTNPELVKRMAEEGHTVGNHTASHPDMSRIDTKQALARELSPVEDSYRAITGEEMAKLYRPPQGKYDEQNLIHASELGYFTVFWSLAYADWDNAKQPDPQRALQTLNSRIHNGAIVLLHSTSRTNAEILDRLISGWKAAGYEFGCLEDLTPKRR